MTYWMVDRVEKVAQRVTEDATENRPRFVKVFAGTADEAIRVASLPGEPGVYPSSQRNIYQEAIDVQNACNLSGVVISWKGVIEEIWEEERAKPIEERGTRNVNRHPVNVLFASKVASLTGCELTADFSRAFAACVTEAVKRGGRG